MNASPMAVWLLLGVLTLMVASGAPGQEPAFPAPVVADAAGEADRDTDLSRQFERTRGETRCDPWVIPTSRLCPDLYGSVESLFLERNNGSIDQPIVMVGATLPYTTVISTQDLQFGYEPGLRALLGARLHDGWAIESSYLGLWNATSSTAITNPRDAPPLRFPDPLGTVPNVFLGANWIGIDYSSQLHSVDLNLVCCRCCCGCGDCARPCQSFEWLVGFRYLNLTEALSIAGRRIEGTLVEDGWYNLRTRNNLYGVQGGARWRRSWGRWSCEAAGKAGIFANDAQQHQELVDFPKTYLRDESAAGGQLAFVGEISLSGIYQLTDAWGLRAGYNLIGIEGVALAPDQLDFSADIPSGNRLHGDGGVLLHGLSVGLEARW